MSGTWNSFDALFDSARASAPKKKRKRKRSDAMTLSALPVESKDVAAACPDVLDATLPTTTPAQVIAETSFFNNNNAPFWSTENYTSRRPFEAPYVRACLQQHPKETLSPEDARHVNVERATNEVVRRDYEERYLREPTGDERKCALDENCQGLQIDHARDHAFILREFLLPSQEETWKRTGQLPADRQLCLMCKRAEVLRAYVNIRADNMGVKTQATLQDYRNLVNVPGEYMLDDCICSLPHRYQGLLDPIVKHKKNAYRVRTINGLRHYEQWKMRKPEDASFLMDARIRHTSALS